MTRFAPASSASRLARADGCHLCLVRSEFALGLLRLSLGDVNAAVDHLLPLVETEEGVSLWPGYATRTLSTAVEALVAAGDLERAQSVLERLEEHAHAMAVPSADAAAARCRAMVLLQHGDLAAARAAIEDALAAHAHLREPFELARTYLAQGSIERRAKRKAEARTALVRAEAIFGELGARLWLERTQRELARTGITRTPRSGADADRAARRGAGGHRCAEQGDRRRAVRQRKDGRGEPLAGLRQARHPVPRPARARAR